MTAIYPGSFDPVTLGHCDIIRRAAPLFDRLIVAVLHNPAKTALFPVRERMALLQEATADIVNVEVDHEPGLLVAYARQRGARYVIRGLRGPEDCAYEIPMARLNRQMAAAAGRTLETLTFFAEPHYAALSSGLVREIAAACYASETAIDDSVLDPWVSPHVKAALQRRYNDES